MYIYIKLQKKQYVLIEISCFSNLSNRNVQLVLFIVADVDSVVITKKKASPLSQ